MTVVARFTLPPPLRGHELVVLGAGAGVLIVGAMTLRGRAPAVAVDGGSDGGGFDPTAIGSLLSQALSQGAAAAVAGFAPGAELGAAGLGVAGQAFDAAAGLAGRAVDSSSYVAGTLADSQAFLGAAGIGLAQQLGQGLTDLLPSPIYPTLPPPVTTPPPDPVGTIQPVPTPNPGPTPVPAPPAGGGAPTSIGARPAGAAGWVQARGVARLWTVSGGVARPGQSGSLTFAAWYGPTSTIRTASGSGTFRQILGGNHGGLWIHTSDAGLAWH